ncbi:reverse transcriptase (RNA-dependent DNA polymerase) domain-containing protein [Phthorimaea operculella]|nr:reverse transcriptase (RNA-dependent DNA polymerase) domain-containing protein [Phthorimaea operculella]
MTLSGSSCDTGPGICDLFSIYFQSTFLESNSPPPIAQNDNSTSPCSISSVDIEKEHVLKLLKNLDLSKGAGPDTIPAIFIVECAKELATPVTLLFQRSIRDGVVPKIWKSAFITPIHKKGPKNAIENYRPISKLCLLAKVLERLVFDQLYNEVKSVIIPQQHGFVRGRSTVSNLVLFNEHLTYSMDKGMQVDAIYTDYSKAFDRIDHSILLQVISIGHSW